MLRFEPLNIKFKMKIKKQHSTLYRLKPAPQVQKLEVFTCVGFDFGVNNQKNKSTHNTLQAEASAPSSKA